MLTAQNEISFAEDEIITQIEKIDDGKYTTDAFASSDSDVRLVVWHERFGTGRSLPVQLR